MASNVSLAKSLVVEPGATLGGSGTFSSSGGAKIANSASVAPGLAYSEQYLATLSFTNLTFGGAGAYNFSIQNASGVAETDYSTVYVSGSLVVTATPGSPFEVT